MTQQTTQTDEQTKAGDQLLAQAAAALGNYRGLYWQSASRAPVDPNRCLHNVIPAHGHGHRQCPNRATTAINGVGLCKAHAKVVEKWQALYMPQA